jgi:hypothetical protein
MKVSTGPASLSQGSSITAGWHTISKPQVKQQIGESNREENPNRSSQKTENKVPLEKIETSTKSSYILSVLFHVIELQTYPRR